MNLQKCSIVLYLLKNFLLLDPAVYLLQPMCLATILKIGGLSIILHCCLFTVSEPSNLRNTLSVSEFSIFMKSIRLIILIKKCVIPPSFKKHVLSYFQDCGIFFKLRLTYYFSDTGIINLHSLQSYIRTH